MTKNPVVSPTENRFYVTKSFSQKPSASGMVAAWFFWHALPSEQPANKLQLSFLPGMQLSTAVTIQQTRRIQSILCILYEGNKRNKQFVCEHLNINE